MLTAFTRKELSQTKALLAQMQDNGFGTIAEAITQVQVQIDAIDTPPPMLPPVCPQCGSYEWGRKVAIDIDGSKVVFFGCRRCRYSELEDK